MVFLPKGYIFEVDDAKELVVPNKKICEEIARNIDKAISKKLKND